MVLHSLVHTKVISMRDGDNIYIYCFYSDPMKANVAACTVWQLSINDKDTPP